MTLFDNYEISPCTRTTDPDKHGDFSYEVCKEDKADIWVLYGKTKGEVDFAIGHFIFREHAEEAFQRITGIPYGSHDEVAAMVRVMNAGPRLLEALLDALPYVEDVLSNPEQLACFKKGTVQAHAKAIRAAIAEVEGRAA